MTKIVMTLLVRDNADIVAANMDFHLAMGVDHIVVTNNRSEDETRNIVLDYVRRGVASLIDEFDDDYDQSTWVTRMARVAARDLSADWVVNSDVDEFWWPLEGNLKSVFSAVPADYGVISAPRLNFLPMRRLSTAFWREMVWRYVVSRNGLGEPLPGKVAHRGAADVTVAAGNHAVESRSLGPTELDGRVVIFHFPYRSLPQYSAKIAKGGQALENNRKAGPGVFHVWRQHHKLQRERHLEDWYRQLPHGDDPIVEEMVAKGEVVGDVRLRTFMASLER
jgi:Glycosyl transferase family 2